MLVLGQILAIHGGDRGDAGGLKDSGYLPAVAPPRPVSDYRVEFALVALACLSAAKARVFSE